MLAPGGASDSFVVGDGAGDGGEAGARILVYPERSAVERRIDVSVYDDRPFTRTLVMGEPQLAVLGFELNVIEPYVDDPRYEFPFWGNGGRISVHERYRAEIGREAELSLRFGAGYGSDGRRAVVAHLWDLHELPATLQRIWHEHRALGKCEMDADYYRKAFLAEPSENVSIYEAFLQLQVEINSVLDVMGMQALFRATYEPGHGPRAFGFFIRPTRKAYLEFVQELDKLLSDNLDRRFFGDVEQYEDIPLKDGHVERRQKGTLRLLEEWLMARFRDVPKERIASIMQPLRGVRGERMKPAHAIVDDEYDLAYHDQQKEWIEKLYDALKELRALLRTDSGAVAYEPPWWEDELGVKTY